MDPRMYPGGVDVVEVTVDPASIAAGAAGDTAITVPGVVLGKSAVVFVNTSVLLDDVTYGGARVTANNEVTVRLLNTHASLARDVASGTWVIGIVKYKS